MSIRSKILAAFLCMCAIVATMGAFGLHAISESGRLVVETFDRPLMAISHARAALANFQAVQHAWSRFDQARGIEAIDTLSDQMDRHTKDLADNLAIARRRAHAPEIVAAVDQVERAMAGWIEARRRFALRQDAEARAAVDTGGTAVADRLDDLVEVAAGEAFLFRKQAQDTIQDNWRLTTIGVALALALAILITATLARRIVRPIEAASSVAGRIAQGELDVDVPPAGPDETGNLLAAMRVMQLNLRAMMQREIAQRRSAQARLVDAIESSPEAIVLVDAGDRILLANTAASHWFAPIGDRLRAGAGFAEFLAEARATGTFAFTSEAPVSDPAAFASGSEVATAAIGEGRLVDGRWLRVSRGSTRDGGAIVFWSDVTNLKERERDLIRARDQARAASAAKTSFLATMSHELRTPLNAIIGFSEMIHRELLGSVGRPEYRDYAGDVERSGRRLLAVINDILDIAKSEAGQLELRIESMSLGLVFEDCRKQVEEQCARQGLRLEYEPPPLDIAIQADAEKLRQILLNLASNAIKFTPKGGMVSVMGYFRQDGDAEIVVSDTGIGMRQEDIPIALSAFEQIDGRLARKYEGTGLGLPLTRALVELHGGRLQIASAPDAGTMVTIRLPLHGPAADLADPAQAGAPRSAAA